MEGTGIICDIFPFGDNRANLRATLHDSFDGKNLLYNGHMDVVPPGDEKESIEVSKQKKKHVDYLTNDCLT